MSVTTRHAAQRARCRTPSGQRAIPGHQAPSSTRPVTSAIASGGPDTPAPTAAPISPPAAAPDSTSPDAFEVVGECDVPAAHPRGSTVVGGVRPGRGRSADRHSGGACGCVPNRRQSRIDDDGQPSGPPRGIYDRAGAALALSQPTDDVIADDFQVTHPLRYAQALSPLLGVPVATLNAMLRRHTGYVVLAKQVSQENAGKISTDTFPGITLVGDSKRIVPNGNLASPVIGFTNGSGVGAGGIEYGDNQKLAGTSGKLTLLESPSGVALPQSPVTDRVASTAGKGLELTLDSQLQYESEQALAGAIETSQALSGTAIVEDVKTGQILSMASLVSTHPNAAGIRHRARGTEHRRSHPDRTGRSGE